MTPRAAHSVRGFTLLEVVVSIALFALLMSLVYSGFSTAVRAYDAAEHRVVEVERMRVVSAFIRRSVGGAHALAIAQRREWAVQFEGEAHRLRYVADLPGYVGLGGLHELVLELQSDGKHHDLVLRRRPLSFDRFGEMRGDFETRTLSERIDGFVLRFYGRLDEGDDPAWRDDWPAGKSMPLLVELRITPEQALPWPVLQVRPQVDALHHVRASRQRSTESPEAPDGDAPAEADSPAEAQDSAAQEAVAR